MNAAQSAHSPPHRVPLVSIGLPVLNGEKLLRTALESLAQQSYPNVEVIVSDNASADQTAAICEELRQQYPHRVFIRRQPHRLEAMKNFEFVLNEARGQFFMWAAHDDRWHPDFVTRLHAVLEAHDEVGVALSAVRRVYEDGEPYDTVRFVDRLSVNRSAYDIASAIARGSPHHLYIYGLYRAALLREAVLDFPSVVGGDRLFAMKVALSTQLGYVDEVLLDRTVHRRDFAARYGEEDLGRVWQNPWWPYKTVGTMLPYLLAAKTIPPHRKLLLPGLLVRLGARYIGTPRAQISRFARMIAPRRSAD